jgi:Ca2+-binding RTX toxin-like protein
MTAISSNLSTTTNAASYSTGDTLTLAADAYLISTVTDAVVLGGLGQVYDVTIDGLISAADNSASTGLWLIYDTSIATITIGQYGVIRGDIGIYLSGSGTIDNNGSILGETDAGIDLYGSGTFDITNTGLVGSPLGYGVYFYDVAAGNHSITNSGEISCGNGRAIYSDSAVSAETIHNTGIINGNISLNGGSDTVHNEAGAGVIYGSVDLGDGEDSFFGGMFAETVTGGAGGDNIIGDGGRDVLDGGDDNDMISGGTGADILTGGTGKDIFVFDTMLISPKSDTITDFSHVDDSFNIDNAVFAGLHMGRLDKHDFKVISSATSTVGVDASDRILYDQTDGDLYFDRDGSGSHFGRIKFAHVDDNTFLSHTDFFVM